MRERFVKDALSSLNRAISIVEEELKTALVEQDAARVSALENALRLLGEVKEELEDALRY